MDTQVTHKVTEILVNKLGLSETEVTPEANLTKDLGIDSLDYAELTMEFEQAFDIRIPDNEAAQITTINQAVDYIKDKLDKK